MALVIKILKTYFIVTIVIMSLYAIRHAIFSFNRMFGRQRLYYQDILTSELPSITVLIPMHNEEKVLHYVLDALLECEYDRNLLEIIPINDHSTDATEALLDTYHSTYPFIRPLHRYAGSRGKPAALNEALKISTGDIVIVFDADYRPGKMMLQKLAVAFCDPEVGAVMGRVIPYNSNVNILTRLLSIERSGGYQANQQARYNLKLMPQYGGTVGGFRRQVINDIGGFNKYVLAEDTELTCKLFLAGYKVIYANDAECYEESPETWAVRGRQVRRWSRGHNSVLFRYLLPILTAKLMTRREKLDGVFMLFTYMIPFLLLLALLVSLTLFYLGEMTLFAGWWVLWFVSAYNSYGNFAPFYEIATGLMIDGVRTDVLLLPLLTFSFYFYLWHTSLGFLDAVADALGLGQVMWEKTRRFAKMKGSSLTDLQEEKSKGISA